MTLNPVYAAAEELLELLVAVAAAEAVDLPPRVYISAGRPENVAWDCEQLVLAMSALEPQIAFLQGVEELSGTPASSSLPSFPTALLGISLVRCHPEPVITRDNVIPPSVEAECAAALVSMTDAALLRRFAVEAMKVAPGSGVHLTAVRAGSVLPGGPEGGFSGTTLALAVTLT